MENALNLEGKIAFVTGSTRGIGLAVARTLARSGATIILNAAHDENTLCERASEIQEEFGVECVGMLADVADAGATRACYAGIFQRFGRLDVLVNNAGILGDAPLGSIHHLQEGSRLMARKQSGTIINISSIVGNTDNESQTIHAALKSALVGLTAAAAKELAPLNIRINAVLPGFIRTETLSEDQYAQRIASIKMGRIGTPEDVANAVLFFASDLSAYVTGQVLGVDGAMLI